MKLTMASVRQTRYARHVSSAAVTTQAIALNRFGLGARYDDEVKGDAKGFLKAQLDRYEPAVAGFAQLPDAGAVIQRYQAQLRARRKAPKPPEEATAGNAMQEPPPAANPQTSVMEKPDHEILAVYRQAVQARMANAVSTPTPFVERLVHFWSNHFCISADNAQIMALAGAFERDAIRPYVLGRFIDMLRAVERHPAMLIYLNQAQSVGPDSIAGKRMALRRGKKAGINENLAREIMELHTLGARSGYTQADVIEFARSLTGRSVRGLGARDAMGSKGGIAYIFRPQNHEPGVRTIMSKRYPPTDADQADKILADFALSPQTAIHISTKLARHFAGDAPPAGLISRLAENFLASDGDLKSLYAVLIDSPEVWVHHQVKFKTPWEWHVSVLRGLDAGQARDMQVESIQRKLGQPVWRPGAPAGWDDVAGSWAASEALFRRLEIAQLIAEQAEGSDARLLAPKLLPGSLSDMTFQQIRQAESRVTALALLFIAPDFMRR